jgi:hypothetical protein
VRNGSRDSDEAGCRYNPFRARTGDRTGAEVYAEGADERKVEDSWRLNLGCVIILVSYFLSNS